MIELIYQHHDFIIVNKPPGIAVQDEVDQLGIIPQLCQQLNVPRLWLVHRLDKITSGLLILAKSADAAAEFGRMFEAHEVQKFYLALATKKPKKKQGTVSGGMKKVRDGMWMLDHSDTQRATTQFFSFGSEAAPRLFVLRPLSGKTHQIRVMMRSLGSPILGDELYKGEPADRTYLHAYGLMFNYRGQQLELLCPPSAGQYFKAPALTVKLTELSAPWTLDWPKVRQASA